MKKLIIIITLVTFAVAPQVQAQGWFDSVKSMLGFESAEAQENQPSMADMITSVTGGLGVTDKQAEGGLGSIFSYVKNNLSEEQFSKLSGALPGLDKAVKSAPDVPEQKADGLSGLLDKAAEYNESIKAVNNVKKQFEALGLKPEMISRFVKQAQTYLDTEQGQEAKKLLTEGLGKLMG